MGEGMERTETTVAIRVGQGNVALERASMTDDPWGVIVHGTIRGA
jgi:hypothetical protein